MGLLLSSLWGRLFGNQEYKIIIVGLNNAGKTTTLYKLMLGEVVVTQPTIGSNLETIQWKNLTFSMWDIGGQESLRSSWSTYYQGAAAVFMVVDSTDRERISLVRDELGNMLRHEHLKSAALLVFANKQDLKGAMTAAELTDALNLHSVKDHAWHIQASCALTGDGLTEGLDWVTQQVTNGSGKPQ